ncbi:2-oxoacid:acceptor oxidoreductase family protein [Kiritimatiella glycovorans]|uniref:Indolepyruvate oxidoreductase subunit beta n=1 Tax=Kiritimatiella glycovorans TaxID=1307763 RepID=A0A0G3EGA1_9BACT|nr:2-oxoacid:acceptor oxidoreductase family protein [Kiritimatiella glycovorans]AKJ63810.1 indolepyruvate oxidoreductase subunit beta [Kiritimatiella glycovorans]
MTAAAITNIKVAGLGGQGVLTATDLIGEVAFRAGRDVKKAEVHGMSQRGGSIESDVRFGPAVLSPMIPEGTVDYGLVFDPGRVEYMKKRLRDEGVLIGPDAVDVGRLADRRSFNVAMLGVLSTHLPFECEFWLRVLRERLPSRLVEANEQAFSLGRSAKG